MQKYEDTCWTSKPIDFLQNFDPFVGGVRARVPIGGFSCLQFIWVLCVQHVALNWNQVISYFDTMADVVREVPQHVLAQPPHIISSFTQEEKKSMPKVGFNDYSAILIVSSNRRLAAANPSLDPCTMRSVKNLLTWIQRQFFFTKQLVSPTCWKFPAAVPKTTPVHSEEDDWAEQSC